MRANLMDQLIRSKWPSDPQLRPSRFWKVPSELNSASNQPCNLHSWKPDFLLTWTPRRSTNTTTTSSTALHTGNRMELSSQLEETVEAKVCSQEQTALWGLTSYICSCQWYFRKKGQNIHLQNLFSPYQELLEPIRLVLGQGSAIFNTKRKILSVSYSEPKKVPIRCWEKSTLCFCGH